MCVIALEPVPTRRSGTVTPACAQRSAAIGTGTASTFSSSAQAPIAPLAFSASMTGTVTAQTVPMKRIGPVRLASLDAPQTRLAIVCGSMRVSLPTFCASLGRLSASSPGVPWTITFVIALSATTKTRGIVAIAHPAARRRYVIMCYSAVLTITEKMREVTPGNGGPIALASSSHPRLFSAVPGLSGEQRLSSHTAFMYHSFRCFEWQPVWLPHMQPSRSRCM